MEITGVEASRLNDQMIYVSVQGYGDVGWSESGPPSADGKAFGHRSYSLTVHQACALRDALDQAINANAPSAE